MADSWWRRAEWHHPTGAAVACTPCSQPSTVPSSTHPLALASAPAQLVDLVARIMALVPPWVRIYRIQRDIPMPLVTSGVEKGNLRELALARMGHLGLKCRDVRTREAGIQDIHHQVRGGAPLQGCTCSRRRPPRHPILQEHRRRRSAGVSGAVGYASARPACRTSGREIRAVWQSFSSTAVQLLGTTSRRLRFLRLELRQIDTCACFGRRQTLS